MKNNRPFAVGIDLGTTNSALAYAKLDTPPDVTPKVELFPIPQLIGAGEFAGHPVLPSFLYIPGEYDISDEDMAAPWKIEERKVEDKNFVGIFARDHGTSIPSRLVSSAKSWLCNAQADRRSHILPWGAGDGVIKISPVQATTAYLKHIRKAWNMAQSDNEEYYLENQLVAITVPASFDEAARDLTVEAAGLAGLSNIILLEEPLAAFYHWLCRYGTRWKNIVNPNELILVCDVGGGTTDFTLIALSEKGGATRFERIAVGDHLILGGDNMDIAIAELLITRAGKQTLALTSDRWKTLVYQCRHAKEQILDKKTDAVTVTMMGAGSRLIAGTVSMVLKRRDIAESILPLFFPTHDTGALNNRTTQEEAAQFGLPYEKNTSITGHLIAFLEKHKADVLRFSGKKTIMPDWILFNGGSLKPGDIQQRLITSLMKHPDIQDSPAPRILDNPEPDLAVAHGAAYYGMVKAGQGVRVGSGSARSFYLGLGSNPGEEVKQAICIVERGLEEGSVIELSHRDFEVLINQPVTISIFSSSYRSGDESGDIVKIDETLTALPPIQTIIQYGKKGVKTRIPVRIQAEYTEMGTLSLWCRSLNSHHRWQFRFQLRDQDETPTEVGEHEVFEESIIADVLDMVDRAFMDPSATELLDGLTRAIRERVAAAKDMWSLGLLRSIGDKLLSLMKQRERSILHECRWLNLAGFCLRPGFGDGFDPHRIDQIWKIYKKGPVHHGNAQIRSEWWILWRRIAGGLPPGQQRQILQDSAPVLTDVKSKGPRLSVQTRREMWMTIANLELLLVKDKVKLGRRLMTELTAKKSPAQLFWALSRIGARELFYGPIDRVVPPTEIRKWVHQLTGQKWQNPKPAITAIGHLVRKTGDNIRDVDTDLMHAASRWMEKHGAGGDQIKPLHEVLPFKKIETDKIFGESLPSGIISKTIV
ncbi:MAG: hsp70 family protein [Desulfobacteraceae bacterium]|nr:hsp70 family protein [Desulfobacteraceae bacterium]